MQSSSKMVKFFTQNCPRCLSKPSSLSDAKCLCIVKGHIVEARGYVEGGDKGKNPEQTDSVPPGPSTKNPEKENEELFIEQTKKALDALKREQQKGQKKPEESEP